MEWLQKGAIFLPPAGAIFRGMNSEMINTMMSHIHLYEKYAPKIEGLKVHIWHLMWEFKNKMLQKQLWKFSVYSQVFIIDCQVWNWFLKFRSGNISVRDTLKELVEYNSCKSTWKLAIDRNTS